MKVSKISASRLSLVVLSAWLMSAAESVRAQQIIPVSSGSALTAAINQAYANSLEGSGTTTIVLGANITGTSQMIINANVIIEGNGYTLNMNNADRAFFVAGGTVAMSNLTITNGNATGGSGYLGSGGGAGLGGAIFVGSGTYNGADGTVAAAGLSVPSVSLVNVSFQNNTAIGGAGSTGSDSYWPAGGGGMGGDGNQNGGGGFGIAAGGGFSGLPNSSRGQSGGAGAFINISGGNTSAGAGGSGSDGIGGAGGLNGGGGGGGGGGEIAGGTGGGGGLGGEGGHYDDDNSPNWGGFGGFGGGGGGGVNNDGGFGGFGGGGGTGDTDASPGGGGFGGGGGGNAYGPGGVGGFGGGNGTSSGDNLIGGGGLGAGGALFVMAGASVTMSGGTFANNTATAGAASSPGNPGSAYGADLFLGGNVTFDVTGTLSLNSLGGAGNTAGDPNVAGHADDPNAQGGIIMQGPGTLVLTGTSYYTGATVINSGTLSLAAGAMEQGTTGMVVGGSTGNATLLLGNGSTLNMSGTAQVITLGQSTGATGTMVISTGGAGVGLVGVTINGGTGGGAVIFDEVEGVAGSGPYPMLSNLTGNLSVILNGSGTTILSPQAMYGVNTYSGGTTVNSGVLQVGNNTSLGTKGVTVYGGMLSATAGYPITNKVTLAGGSYKVVVGVGLSYAGIANATSDFGNGRSTTAEILAGTASNGATLLTSFSATSQALNDGMRQSDVYAVEGTGGDLFVLELSVDDELEGGSYLGWLNMAGNTWENAVLANTGNNAIDWQLGFEGSFAAFQTVYGADLSLYVGAYGIDTETGSVWAVLNTDSANNFAVVPEPGSVGLLLAGGVSLLAVRKWRRRLMKLVNKS